MHQLINLAKLSSIGIGSPADVYMIEDDQYPNEANLIGAGNNILFGDELPPLMKLSKRFDFIHNQPDGLHIGAATPGGKIVSYCKKNDIAHFEFLSHLPGTLGGMLKMNAGLKTYEIFNHLTALRMATGWKTRDEIDYGYRYTNLDDVVFEAVFERTSGFDASLINVFKAMRANQPQDPSAGSAFKNPPGDYAGRLIESVGLRGHRIGDMAFSDKHANFLVNLGKGTFDDAITLLKLARTRVFESAGIMMQHEIIIVDRRFLPIPS